MSMNRGFTLLETLVAVMILSLAVAGPLYVADRALVAAHISRDQLTASYLAQEGIEYIRSMRDREFLYAHDSGDLTASDDAWQAFLFGGGSGQGNLGSCRSVSCALDPSLPMGSGGGNALHACGATCDPIYMTSEGRYTLSTSGSAATIYTRKIDTTLISATDLKVVSTVTFINRGTSYTISVVDNLTPWQ